MLMKWFTAIGNKAADLTGTRGTEKGEFVSAIASFVAFFVAAYLVVLAVAFVTGISAGFLWSTVCVASLVYTGWQYIKR